MTVTALVAGTVIGGIDTHLDTIHVAVIDPWGRDLGDREFPTSPAGYRQALDFLTSYGEVVMIGIEGTSSYGAGVTRFALKAGLEVREVIRPERSVRRRQGKSDPLDAYEAARAALSGRATAPAKSSDIESLRALHNARRSAVKARQSAQVQIRALLVTAPVTLREKYRGRTAFRLIRALAVSPPAMYADPVCRGVLTALKALAQRHQHLTAEISDLEHALGDLLHQAAPHLLQLHGVGVATAAQLLVTAGGNPERLISEASFAALCGAAPVLASSGKTTRHRLSRGGDRQANHALHTIAVVRMGSHPRTRDFVQRQRDRGRSNPRDPPDPQTSPRPRAFQTAVPTPTSTRHRRPTPRPTSQEHHPARSRGRHRNQRHGHQPHGTRPLPQRRPHHPLPDLAPRCLTPIGASTALGEAVGIVRRRIGRGGRPAPVTRPGPDVGVS
jgi:transposase